MKGYIGCYDSENSQGIFEFSLDSRLGKIEKIEKFIDIFDGKCVNNLDKDILISTIKKDNKQGICLIDKKTKKILSAINFEDASPCFVEKIDEYIYTANYHDGLVNVYEAKDNMLKLKKSIAIGKKAGCHQVLKYQNYILVPCLLIDEIQIFDIEKDFAYVKSLKYDKNTGPRHGVFNKDFTKFYLVTELSNQLFIYDVSDLEFKNTKIIDLLKKQDAPSTSAAIRLSSNEKYLYISTRGKDIISVIDLEDGEKILQQINCGGKHPRDFVLSPDNNYLISVNKDSNDLIVWLVDKEESKLLSIVSRDKVPSGISIVFNE